MRHAYLISYSHGQGFGHQDVTLPHPLQPEHLLQIIKVIGQKSGSSSIVITSIYKFEPPAQPHTHLGSCRGVGGMFVCGHP